MLVDVRELQLEKPDILEIDAVVVRHEAERDRRVFGVTAVEQSRERGSQPGILHRERLGVPEIHKLALLLHPHGLLLVVPVELGHELEEHEHLPHFVVVVQRLAQLKLADGKHDAVGAARGGARRSRRLRRVPRLERNTRRRLRRRARAENGVLLELRAHARRVGTHLGNARRAAHGWRRARGRRRRRVRVFPRDADEHGSSSFA
mmetsp:Transcript_3273/g.13167  ORF Transcript_3273/g.13167 Transcript_3273/m.13167 type:complete len:205 (-) Transcript_3273:1947-2561(-)